MSDGPVTEDGKAEQPETYRIQAEAPIIAAFAERPSWITVTPTAIATSALTALYDAGWRLIPPADLPGFCARCRCPINAGTAHYPWNGNQMFACEVVPTERPAANDVAIGVASYALTDRDRREPRSS